MPIKVFLWFQTLNISRISQSRWNLRHGCKILISPPLLIRSAPGEDMMLVGGSSYDPLMNATVTNIIVILSIILASSLKLIKCFLFSDAVKWKFIFGGNVVKAAAKSWHCQNIVDLLTPFLTCSTQCQLIIFFRAPVNLHFSSIYIF